ncbi:helix-turn-helix domain-containing protein [Desertivirga arenae]|uniref:helix-turn-helix domain-containing protein n=1 Tax=Desertivirga arenae TaxID=2810309 RepID=UPI001A95C178|nr:helix-turn-helix domain-containing protein [Pedobacter sp. SYSU D00823]
MLNEIKIHSLLVEQLQVLKDIRKFFEDFFKPKRSSQESLKDDGYVKEFLGISETTLWRMKRRGILVGSKLGGRDYYTKEYLLQVLEDRKRKKGK